MAGEAGAPARLAAMIVHHRHAEMQLDIGHVELGTGFEEAAAFGDVRRHRSATLAPVLRNSLENSRDAGKRQAGEIRRVRGEAEYKVRMILQVLSDAGQMMRGCDAVLRQRGAVADAGKHQQLRALKRAGGKDYFAANPVYGGLAVSSFARVEHPDDRHPDECCRSIPEVTAPIARADRQGDSGRPRLA